jgi:potassium-transporting ATPase KdpC subunit
VTRLKTENPKAPGAPPIELVTTSASGFDPDLSPGAAAWQIPRVAAARGLSEGEVQTLVDGRIEARTFGFLGEPRVNVLLLNLDLDQRFGRQGGNK